MKKSHYILAITAAILCCASPAAFAANETWNGLAGDGNWDTMGNWVGGIVPGSITVTTSGDSASFNNGSGTVTIPDATTQDIGSILFDYGVGNFTIAPLPMPANLGTGVLAITSGGNITLGSSSASVVGSNLTESVAAPILLEGNASFTNNSTNSTDILSIGAAGTTITDAATSGTLTLTLSGSNTGNNIINANIGNNGSGIVGLTKSGSGTWILAGANGYGNSGTGTTVSAGTLIITGTNGFETTTVNGGILSLQHASAIGANPLTGLQVSGGTVNETVANAIGNGTSITVSGGTLNLSQSNNIGTSALNGGVINITGASGFNGGGILTLNTLGTANGELNLAVTNAYTDGNGFINNGGLVVEGAVNAISGGTTVTIGGGSILLSQANNYTGTTTVNSGVLAIGGSIGNTAVTQSGGTIRLNNTSAVSQNTLNENGGVLVENALNAIGGSTTLKVGGGTVNLSQSNAFTGSTTVSNGKLYLGSSSSLTKSSSVTVSGGAFNYDPTSIANLTWNTTGGALTLSGTTGSIGAEIGGTGIASAAATIAATTATTTGATFKVNVFELSGANPTAGAYTLVSATAGSLANGTYSLGSSFNNTNFTVTSVGSSATSITATISAATPITTAYWLSGATGLNTNVWAQSNGGTALASTNWSQDAGGTVSTGGVVPGTTTDVTFGGTSTTSTNLGANMSIMGLTITDNGGNFTILANDGNTLTVGTDNLTYNTTSNDTIAEALGGAMNLIKLNTGTLSLNNPYSTYTGATQVDAGILNVANVANAGSISAIGAPATNAASGLVFGGGTLQYSTGVVSLGVSTDRLFTLGDVNGNNGAIDSSSVFVNNTISFTNTGAIAFGTTGAQHTLTLTGSNGPADTTNTNTFAPLLANDGSGDLTNLVKTGAGTWFVTNTGNTFTGVAEIDNGILNAASLANSGSASSIGAGTLVFGGGTLQFTGSTSQTTNRLFTLGDAAGNNATIDSSGSAPISFTNTGILGFGSAAGHSLTLTGTNTGANTLNSALTDQNGQSGLTKSGTGNWIYAPVAPSGTTGNFFSGGITISGGTLQLGSAAALASASESSVAINSDNGLTFSSGIGAFNIPALSGANGESLMDVGGSGVILNSGTLLTPKTGNPGTGTQYSSTYTGVLSGTGGLNLINQGRQIFSASNTYSGGTTISKQMFYEGGGDTPFVQTTLGNVGLSNNTPFGTGSMDILGGSLFLSPSVGSGSNQPINYVGATAVGSTFIFNGGNLTLQKGNAASLTYTLGSGGAATVIDPSSTNLIISTSANDLGTGENLLISGAAPAMGGGNNGVGMVSGGIINSQGWNFLTYDPVEGFISLTTAVGGGYTSVSGTYTPDANGQDIALFSGSSTLTINAGTDYGLDLDWTSTGTGTIATINGTLNLGNGSGQAGLVFNVTSTGNDTLLSGGTLNFGAAEGVVSLVTNGQRTDTETSVLAGTNGLIIQGTGSSSLAQTVFQFGNNNSTLTGGITVEDGLAINIGNSGNNRVYGDPSQTFTLSDGGLIGTNGAGRTVNVTQAGGFLASAAYGYNFAGPGVLATGYTGSDQVVLAGNNSGETGGVVLMDGFLKISSGNNIGSASAPLTFNGAQQSNVTQEVLEIEGPNMKNMGGHPINFGYNNSAGTLTVGIDVADPTNIFTLNQPINNGLSNFSKFGAGTLVLNGAYTGGSSATAFQTYGGTVQFNEGNGGIISQTAMPISLAGGSLDFVDGSSTNITQNLAKIGLAGSGFNNYVGGAESIIADSSTGSGNMTVNLGVLGSGSAGAVPSLTAAGTALDLVVDGTGTGGQGTSTITSTTKPDSTTGAGSLPGIYGGRVVFTDAAGNVNWATSTSVGPTYVLSGYTNYDDFNLISGLPTDNVTTTGSETFGGGFPVNSLKLIPTGSGQSLDLEGNSLVITSGGILFANTTTPYTIADSVSGGSLVAGSASVSTNGTGNTDLIVQQYAAAPLTISAVIANATVANGGITSGTSASTLTKAGPGTLILTAANTYTGATFIEDGVLSVSANNQLGDPTVGSTIILNGGTLQATSSFGLFNGTAGTKNRNIQLGSGGGTLDAINGSTLTVAGSISSFDNISGTNSSGPSELTVTSSDNSNSFINLNGGVSAPDGINIDGGTLNIAGGFGDIGSPLTFNPGVSETHATYFMNNANSSFGGLTSTSSLSIIENNSTSGSGVTFYDLQGFDSTYAGTLIDGTVVGTKSLGFTKSGGGDLSLTNTGSSYTGVTEIDNGIINVASLANGGTNSSIGASTSAASNLLFQGASQGQAVVQYTGTGAVSTDRLFTIGGTNGGNGTIDASGATTASTVTFSSTGAVAYPGASFPFGINLTLTGSNTGANTFAPTIGDNGATSKVSLNKSGAGTWVLTNTNAYSGGTTVSGGTLYANGGVAGASSGVGTGAVSVASGAALGGSGVYRPTTSGAGVTLASGSSLISGAVQTSTTAGTGLTLDNRTAAGTILDASIGSANLTFSLGAGNPSGATPFSFDNPNTASTYMTVLGGTAGELKFAMGDTITLTDLTSNQPDGFGSGDTTLQLNLGTPYLLVQAESTSGLHLLTDNDLYSGLMTTGGIIDGVLQNGFVTTPITINGTVPGEQAIPDELLYLDNGMLEVVPEPNTWAMLLVGLMAFIFLQRRRDKLS